jgi:NADPH:quinone reductase-like Zn-dependent oxidoreductase
LNWLDVLLRTEDFGLTFPHIAGSDVVGILEAPGSLSLPRGSRVIVNPAMPCGHCPNEADDPDKCKFVRILGVHCAGGYGSFVAVPEEQIYPLPNGISWAEGAAFPLDYLTAWRMLVTKAKLQQGERVFIWGASGSLGTAAVKIAKWLGSIVLYKTEDVESRTKYLTDGEGVDCVFESVGAATFSSSMTIVRPHGRIVICGTRSGNFAKVNLEDLYYNQIQIFGSRMGSKSEFEAILSHILDKEWRPILASTMPLEKVREAHSLLENRRSIGKIVMSHDA